MQDIHEKTQKLWQTFGSCFCLYASITNLNMYCVRLCKHLVTWSSLMYEYISICYFDVVFSSKVLFCCCWVYQYISISIFSIWVQWPVLLLVFYVGNGDDMCFQFNKHKLLKIILFTIFHHYLIPHLKMTWFCLV